MKPMPSLAPTTADIRPLLRGWLHLICAIASIPVGILVIANAEGGRARLGAAVYAVGLLTMFSVSAIYHRVRWSERVRPWMKRADHAAIFVMIAGTYTPLCLIVLRDSWGAWLLLGAWIGAVLGVVGAITGIAERKIVGLIAYSVFGWAAMLSMPALIRNLDPIHVALLIFGGVVYTIGSIGLGTRWPRGVPQVFGYHEIWHVLVVIAVAAHFAVVWSAVS